MKILNLLESNPLFQKYFVSGKNARSVVALRNVIYSSLSKVIGMLIGFWMVPLTLNYLNPTKYGIWLTLSAVISWLALLDIGLGNGLRNKFAEALAKGDTHLAKIYVSTTYAIVGIIVIVVYVVFIIFHSIINWKALLNTPPELAGEVRTLALVLFTFFLFRLFTGLITSILTANQKLASVGFIDLIINALSLVVIIILPFLVSNSLLWVGTGIGFVTMAVPAMASIYFFSTSFKRYAPSLKFVDFKFFQELKNLSLDFFILSVSTIIIYFSQNLIISRLLGPAEVTTFNIAYKYFFYVVVIHTLVLNPMLPATTEAYFKADFDWIKRTLRRLIYLWIFLVILVLGMVFSSEFVYKLWIGNTIKVPFSISLAMGCHIILFTWYATFAYIINGIGKIKLQLYLMIIISLLVIPLSIILVKTLHLGVEGVIFAGFICTVPGSIIIPIQLNKILNNKARGLWNK